VSKLYDREAARFSAALTPVRPRLCSLCPGNVILVSVATAYSEFLSNSFDGTDCGAISCIMTTGSMADARIYHIQTLTLIFFKPFTA
jgi:hypothetical protein